eukprot:jgi/Galph1/2818/GphlegSOOS_G1484.1
MSLSKQRGVNLHNARRGELIRETFVPLCLKNTGQTFVCSSAGCQSASKIADQPLLEKNSSNSYKRPWFFGGAPRRIAVWFFADLRVGDNEALVKAVENASVPGGIIIPMLALYPGIPTTAVLELRTELRKRGSDLCILPELSATAITSVCEKYGLEAIFYNYAEIADQVELQSDIIAQLEKRGLQTEGFWCSTLISPLQLEGSDPKEMGFRKFAMSSKDKTVAQPCKTPERLPRVPEDIPTIQDLSNRSQGFSITESTAWSLLTSQLESNEAFDGAFIFQMKPYLDHGCVSPRTMFHFLNGRQDKDSSSKMMLRMLHPELLWRSYVCAVSHQKSRVGSRKLA